MTSVYQKKCATYIQQDIIDSSGGVYRMWCVTPKILDNGTTNNLQSAQCWSLMHCQNEVPSSQKPRHGQDS